jgi:hypothetical protein
MKHMMAPILAVLTATITFPSAAAEQADPAPERSVSEAPARVPPARFRVVGVLTPDDEERLRQALSKVTGVGLIRVRRTPRGTMVGVRGGSARPEAIVAAAKALGFELTPVLGAPGGGRVTPEGERITPAAPSERIRQDLTRVGDVAPDFTLITRKGKGRITLSDYRGKKPVVLLFGSYT